MPNERYKPRHGYDIRIKPHKEGKKKVPKWADAGTQICCREGCTAKAVVRVSKSPREPDEKIWLCAEHAAEHNKSWNYFDGMSAKEAEAARMANIYGDRPTWSMGSNERASAAARTKGPADFQDSHGLFTDAAAKFNAARGSFRDGRKLTKLQEKAFQTFDLKPSATKSEIKKRYAELVRRFHPDSNEGDRSAEAQLQEVVKAHGILKKAGIC
ncbi:MAG: J domain-containing protein [Pseudomonadota bacterium]